MSYAQYLRQLLRPLGVYDVEGRYLSGELEAEGLALDGVESVLDELQREANLATAEDWGLERIAGLLRQQAGDKSLGDLCALATGEGILHLQAAAGKSEQPLYRDSGQIVRTGNIHAEVFFIPGEHRGGVLRAGFLGGPAGHGQAVPLRARADIFAAPGAEVPFVVFRPAQVIQHKAAVVEKHKAT